MARPDIWINAGEPSGDFHGALLARQLQRLHPGCAISGMGGDELLAAGQTPVAHIRQLSVMGFTEVLGQLPTIVLLLRRIRRELQRRRPDVVVCIDAPDFNFRVVTMARKLGIPVVYYISPKIWAWRKGRARFIQRHVSRMLCILPFEQDFYRQYGMEPEYVGNPLVDAMDWPTLEAITPAPDCVGLLPGSRKKELRALLPEFLKAARLLHQHNPGLRFALARAPGVSEERIREVWRQLLPPDFPLELAAPAERHALMRRSALCIAASGTVTLETALLGTPTIVAYKLSPLTFALARRVVRVPYISLPNLILGEGVFPEHLQQDADAAPLAARAVEWLATPGRLDAIRQRLERLRELLGPPGAPERAARSVLEAAGHAPPAQAARS